MNVKIASLVSCYRALSYTTVWATVQKIGGKKGNIKAFHTVAGWLVHSSGTDPSLLLTNTLAPRHSLLTTEPGIDQNYVTRMSR